VIGVIFRILANEPGFDLPRTEIWAHYLPACSYPGEGILVIASRLRPAAKSNGLRARVCGLSRLMALPLLSLFAPATASADFYKWIDERGNPVLSNVRPANPAEVRNFEVVVREKERAPQKDPTPQLPPTRTEQMLLDRIENLERQLQARQYPPQAPPAPVYSESYYPTPPPPLPTYSGDYYPAYSYPLAPVYSSVFYPARTFVRRPVPVFHRGGFMRGSSGHRGRR
jgi:hypothetical protein